MCIISDMVDTVSSTKILAIPSKNGKRQLTVYSNKVLSPESNVMCIPVPNPNSVRFENVPSDIFSKCAQSFKLQKSCMDYFSNFCNSSYNAVIVRSMNEINNQNGFIISENIIEFLKKTYPNYGVILCKLKKGKHKYKPLAYSHNIDDKLFLPTKQYYKSIKEEWSVDYIKLKTTTQASNGWDHTIYSVGTPRWCHESAKIIQNNKINWSKMPEDYYLDYYVILNCYEKNGYYPNIDILMPFILSLLY